MITAPEINVINSQPPTNEMGSRAQTTIASDSRNAAISTPVALPLGVGCR